MPGRAGALPLQTVRHQGGVHVLGGLLGAGDQGDGVSHHVLDRSGEQRVVRAAEHERVHIGSKHRCQVLPGQVEHLRPAGDAALDQLHELRRGGSGQLQVRGGGEGVLVGAGVDGRAGADHPDASGTGGGHGAPHGRLDHLDHRDPPAHGVALARVAQHCSGGGVARDHQHLHPGGDQVVHHGQRVRTHLGDRQRAVGSVGGVADVEHGLFWQLVDDGPGYRQTPDTGVEDADRCIIHHLRA